MVSDQPVIRCYNMPRVPDCVQARLTAEGLFVADYNSGWSLSSAQVSEEKYRPAAGNAFNRIMEISNVGGIGLIRTQNDDDEIITVGEWKSNCATFREINGQKLKGIQMAKYGLITPQDPQFPSISEFYSGGASTVDMAKNRESLIRDTIDELESKGRLRQPSYL